MQLKSRLYICTDIHPAGQFSVLCVLGQLQYYAKIRDHSLISSHHQIQKMKQKIQQLNKFVIFRSPSVRILILLQFLFDFFKLFLFFKGQS